MTKERYKSLISGDAHDSEVMFWVQLGIFLVHSKHPQGKWSWRERQAEYFGKWIVEGAGPGGREIGRCLDSKAHGKDYNFPLQAQQLAQSAVSAIVASFAGEDVDGYLRQWRLREGYQQA
jgi:hypothetical protein